MSSPEVCGPARGLTFDMRGGRQLAKPDVGRPLDGRIRAHWRRTHPHTDAPTRPVLACPGPEHPEHARGQGRCSRKGRQVDATHNLRRGRYDRCLRGSGWRPPHRRAIARPSAQQVLTERDPMLEYCGPEWGTTGTECRQLRMKTTR